MNTNNKLLLVGVFGPFGIKDEYAEGIGMQMELLNNQITRMQNIHSIRQHYWTMPLYLLAENISVPTVVLDFPLWEDFTQELNNGYTHVGINFIVPNVLKAKRMAEYIREKYPNIKIILGGYGTIIPELDKIMPYDELCKGEGVTWLREYFGEDPNAPLIHPIIENPIDEYMYGFKRNPKSSVIMPGVGCKNGCEFCITSHKFGKKHIALLKTGKEIFNVCEKINEAMDTSDFFIMDENFLKQPEKARELLMEMEKNKRPYVFQIFSSAEVVKQLGVEFMVRFGVRMIWIGVESKSFAHSKLQGIDLKSMIADLQAHGITVNTSAILFLDHHTEEAMQEDIDWTISLGADMTQFMNYTPYPTTSLYERLEREGRIKDLGYQYQTGQSELNWVHPHITDPVKHFEYTKQAFRKKYEVQGPAILNIAITATQGYLLAKEEYKERLDNRMVWDPKTLTYIKAKKDQKVRDEFFELRIEMLKRNALVTRPLIAANITYAVNEEVRKKAKYAQKLYKEAFGNPSPKDVTLSMGVLSLAGIAATKHKLAKMRGHESVILQPPTNRIEYNMVNTSNALQIVEDPDKIAKDINPQQWIREKIRKISNVKNPITWFINLFEESQESMEEIINKMSRFIYTEE